MSDVIDKANDQADYLLECALAARQKLAPAYTVSAEYCDDCGVAIPGARRVAVPGCQTCVDCQGLREVRRG